MFVIGHNGDDVNEYKLTTPFDISTAVAGNNNIDEFNTNDQETSSNGLAFNLDGTKMYVVGEDADYINEYTLSKGFDLSTAVYAGDGERFLVSGQESQPIDIDFNSDGTKMYIVGWNGNDINESTSPIEANLKWAIPQRRREEGGFVGYEKIKSDLNGSLSRLRVGIKPEGKIIAREGVKIFSEAGKEIGSITSGTFGPSVNGPIAMGYVKLNFSKPGTKVFLEVRGKKHEAKISELPFYKKSYVR